MTREVAEARGPRRTDACCVSSTASDSASETVTREVAEARGPRRTGACCVSPNEVGFHWVLEYMGRILTLRCVWRTNT